MSWARPVVRLLMVVTFLVAALALAPTGALAHAGHNHAAQPETATAQKPMDAQKFSVAPVSAQELTTRAVPALADLVPTTQKKSHHCGGGCCSGSMGCCAAWFDPPTELLIPIVGRLAPNFTVSGGAGITPDALPEPPKSRV